MALDQYFDDATTRSSSLGEENSVLDRWKPKSHLMTDSSSAMFDCNICLDGAKDPVVSLCGHLFCWPCIYKWLYACVEDTTTQPRPCPVCKSPISDISLVPLYGKGQTANPTNEESRNEEIPIPGRPPGPISGVFRSSSSNGSHDHYGAMIDAPSGTMAMTNNPSGGVFGEMVYARAFGSMITNLYVYPNSYDLLGSSGSSPRIRIHIKKADKSLNRICIFFFCCSILCLLLF